MPETKEPYPVADERRGRIGRVLDATDELIHGLSEGHTSDFLDIDVTMPQAKSLYLIAVAGDLRMSSLAARLGVTLSTVSGLVDRLVERGLVTRHDDPLDRRQVVVTMTATGTILIQRFRELNGRRLGELLDRLTDRDLALVERAIGALLAAARDLPPSAPGRLAGAPDRHSTDQGGRS